MFSDSYLQFEESKNQGLKKLPGVTEKTCTQVKVFQAKQVLLKQTF
jgi:hypothetical protein